MKNARFWAIVMMLVALLSFSAASATAAGVGPSGALYLDNQTHSIGAQSTAWYRFDYKGDESLVTLTLLNGAKSNISFAVFAPSQLANWWSETAIGQSSAVGDDLTWTGSSPASGTYYVKIENTSAAPLSYELVITGSGVGLSPALTPGKVEPPAAATTTKAVDPMSAAPADKDSHTIAGNSSNWYRYQFARDSEATLTVPLGSAMGLEVRIYSGSQIATWWKADPMGAGSPVGDDLIWVGDQYNGDMIYIEVINPNPGTLIYTLNLTAKHLVE